MEATMQTSSTTKVDREQLESVQGRISFARRSPDEKAPARVEPLPFEFDVSTVDYDVTIRNARPIVNELSLEKEGLILAKHKTSCANERDPDVMKKKYLEEMSSFLQDYFKASLVMPAVHGGFIVRFLGGDRQVVEQKSLRVTSQTAGYAHADYSPVGAPMAAARDSQLRGKEIRSYSRLIIAQTWRALSPAPQDTPLAFCDGSSVPKADLVDVKYSRAGERGANVWFLHHNPAHRWYYFPDMTSDEVMVFKGYDSDAHYRVWTPHSAFDNRRAYPEAKPRESVEARFYVYYD